VGRIVSENELIAGRLDWARNGLRVVFVHGVFDLLHPGHIRLLEQARSLGNLLVVAVQSDARNLSESAAASAGANDRKSESPRIVTPSAERAEIVAALAAVDFVIETDAAAIADFAERLRPDVFVKGASPDKSHPVAEEIRTEEIVMRAGGTVTVIPLEPGYSKNSLMERIRQASA
jgi:rfaE bifunctional protein nucleotidyltransferase chain/domain